jgi:hypothetical protein
MNPPPLVDPEAALQLDELHGASLITRALTACVITVLAVASVSARGWGRLKWRLFTQSQCCECKIITRRAWLPLLRSRRASRHTSYTWCPECARKARIEL